MNASDRRHTRYVIREEALLSQKISGKGLLAAIRGQVDCRVRDMSVAGALVLTSRKYGIGDVIDLELTERSGRELRLGGKVVNCGIDALTGLNKLGISLSAPRSGTPEHAFLEQLASSFPEAR